MTTIWGGNPSGSIVNADNTYKSQKFTSGIAQSIFTLTTFIFAPGTGSLLVLVNGVDQYLGTNYTENADGQGITFTSGLRLGDTVVIRGLVGSIASQTAATSASQASVSAANAQAYYNSILALALPSLPLVIGSGGTGQSTASAGFKALAPAPGSVGNVLGTVDGINWTAVNAAPGSGGATVSINTVLTNTSGAAQSITPTSYGQSFTLPDATTMPSLGSSAFNLTSLNDYPVKILNSAGTLLGFIPGMGSVVVGLSSKATALGVWELAGMVPLAVTARKDNLATNSATNARISSRVVLDANRTLLLIVSDLAAFAQIYDSSTLTWGAPTAIRIANTLQAAAILSAANQVLVVSCRQGQQNLQAVTLSITGTAITVNTFTTEAVAAIQILDQLVQVGAYFVVTYYSVTAGSTQTQAISIAGTVPTIGAALALPGTQQIGSYTLPVTATTYLATSRTSATVITFTPVTISAGPNLAAGTAVTVASGGPTTARSGYKILPTSVSTRFVVVYDQGSVPAATTVTLTGTVATAGTAINIGVLGFATDTVGTTDYALIGTRLVGVIGQVGSGPGFLCLDISVVNLVAGTYLNLGSAGNLDAGFNIASINGNAITVSGLGTSGAISYTIDIGAGTTCTLTGMNSFAASSTVSPIAAPTCPNQYLRDPNKISGALGAFQLQPTNSAIEGLYTTPISFGRMRNITKVPDVLASKFPGASNETWCIGNPLGALGYSLQRIECAA